MIDWDEVRFENLFIFGLESKRHTNAILWNQSRGLALWIEDTEQLGPQGGLNVQHVFVQPFFLVKKGNTEKQHENIYGKYFCIYLYVRDVGTASKLEIFLLFTSFTASPRGLEWNSQVATSVSSVLTDVFDMLTALCEQQLQGITWHCKRKIAVNKYLESDVFIIRLPFLISFTSMKYLEISNEHPLDFNLHLKLSHDLCRKIQSSLSPLRLERKCHCFGSQELNSAFVLQTPRKGGP